MKKMLILAFILAIAALPAWSQSVPDTPTCFTGCPGGQSDFGFTIPVGGIVTALQLIGLPIPIPPGGILFLPDISVRLSTTFSGDAWVHCPVPPCCESGVLMMGANLRLSGTATIWGVPPRSAGFTSLVPLLTRIHDNTSSDRDTRECSIDSYWKYTKKDIQVSLQIPFTGGLLALPVVDTAGEGWSECIVSYGCGEYESAPSIVSWPTELVVPIGGEVHFTVVATVLSSEIYPTVEGAPLPRSPLTFTIESSLYPGVSIEITSDTGPLVRGGEGVIRVALDAPIPDGTSEELEITVFGPHGADQKRMTVRYVNNRPPRAIDRTTIIKTEALVRDRVIEATLSAVDPDLTEYGHNHSYNYLFIWADPLLMPNHWDCPCPMHSDFSPLLGNVCVYGPIPLPQASISCRTKNIEQVLKDAHNGVQWTGDFMVLEVKGVDFGFGSTASWTVIVNNKPPQVSLATLSITAQRGEIVEVTVTATDLDGDTVSLAKVFGPGTFPEIQGRGRVSGTYTWTVPAPHRGLPWRLVGFKATDTWETSDTAYLLIHVRTAPRISSGRVTLHSGDSTTTLIYAEDPDSDSLNLSFAVPAGITVEKIGEKTFYEYEDWGHGGRFYELKVDVEPGVNSGLYEVAMTATDPDGLKDTATLWVTVIAKNNPPAFSPPSLDETVEVYVRGGGGGGGYIFLLDPDWFAAGCPDEHTIILAKAQVSLLAHCSVAATNATSG